MRVRGSRCLVVATLVAALAACSQSGSGGDPTPTPTSTGSPSAPPTAGPGPGGPSASPTPSAPPTDPATEPGDDHPPLGALVISPSGLGPLTVGVPPAVNPGAAMIEWDADHCAEMAEPGTDPGRWVASGYGDDVSYLGEPVPAFFLDADDSAVHRIDVLGVGPATERGVRIGTTVEELRQAYPELEGPVAGPLSQVWLLPAPEGTLVFETQGDADGLRPAGTPEGVILMRVLAPGLDASFAAANSGNVAGACM